MTGKGSRIRIWMEHSDCLQHLIPAIRKLGIVHALHSLEAMRMRRRNGEERAAFKAFYEAHRGDFDALNAILEDDFSKKTLQGVIEFRKNWRMRALKGIVVPSQYFQRDIFGPVDEEVFIDGGAYTGDTIMSLFNAFGGGQGLLQKNICLGTR